MYKNDKYAFAVQYPDGWNVTDNIPGDGPIVHFFNGHAAQSTWDTHVFITAIEWPDNNTWSDVQEREYQIDYVKNRCDTLSSLDGFDGCSNFKVVGKGEPGFTINGHPKITTIFIMTIDYENIPTKDMIGTITSIYSSTSGERDLDPGVSNVIWNIFSESDDTDTIDLDPVEALVNSFQLNAGTGSGTFEYISPYLPSLEEEGGCLIATAAFGSEMASQVQFLRELRDNTILQTESGTSFMAGFNQFYYSFSPAVADYERENPVFKEAVKITLTPLLTSLTLLQYADIDSESEMLGYGIGIILLNIGMYFVAPAVLIMKIRK
jgi:hypothetical protein